MANVVAKERIGLIAGWGRFPVLVAEALRRNGHEVYCLGIRNHADPILNDICNDFRQVGLARVGAQIRYFRRHGIRYATMAGKIFKHLLLFHKFGWLGLLPDWRGIRAGWSSFVANTKDRNDDTVLTAFVRAYADDNIQFLPATDFAPELLVNFDQITHQRVSRSEKQDVEFGWQVAKEMGRLDIGQTVVVRDRITVAVEAVEGTDECIRRAGQVCPKGGFTVVKVAKPQQDMRFDVPTIGVGTLETIADAGGRILAIEAGKTIILDEAEVIAFAKRHKLTIVAVRNGQLAPACEAA